MKKLFIVGFALVVLVSSLMVPNQVVSAEVGVTEVQVTGTIDVLKTFPLECDRSWTAGGISHMRNCVVYMNYTSDDFRFIGPGQIIMSRNIFSEDVNGYPARGHGSWALYPIAVDGGWWAGTFVANIDATGYMTVNIRGKGYGTLKGLFYETTTHGIGGPDTVYITTLPSYDGPEP